MAEAKRDVTMACNSCTSNKSCLGHLWFSYNFAPPNFTQSWRISKGDTYPTLLLRSEVMKADALKRAQAKKSLNRRRVDAKKGDAAIVKDAGGSNELDIREDADSIHQTGCDDKKSQREREREARNEKKAKQAADTAMHRKSFIWITRVRPKLILVPRTPGQHGY